MASNAKHHQYQYTQVDQHYILLYLVGLDEALSPILEQERIIPKTLKPS